MLAAGLIGGLVVALGIILGVWRLVRSLDYENSTGPAQKTDGTGADGKG